MTGAQVAIHSAHRVVFPVAVIVSPGKKRVTKPPVDDVFQPTNVNPVFTRLPVLPGMVGDENSLLVIVDGTEPVVGVLPLNVMFRFHIANKVREPVAVKVSPGRKDVPLLFAAVFQPAKVKLVLSKVVGAGRK